jgi:hypothetical protein
MVETHGSCDKLEPRGDARQVQWEWDDEKAAANASKHGVHFQEAATVFDDPLATSILDPHHSVLEERWLTTGQSSRGRLLIVWHTYRGTGGRIVGARLTTPNERRTYESGE